MANQNVAMTLDTAVAEVLAGLTGLDLSYEPEMDRYAAVTRALNRALRATALDSEWACYVSTEELGNPTPGENIIRLRDSVRPRQTGDDSVRLLDNGIPVEWAYFLPRDALHKYRAKPGIWVSLNNRDLIFSRPFTAAEGSLTLELTVLREPDQFRLPEQPEDPDEDLVLVPDEIREQLVDFAYPDLIIARALYFYAQTDPVAQPRVPTLENDYKTLMYALAERDNKSTDSPYQNEFLIPVTSDIYGNANPLSHLHPHAATRRF